jgi:hypothetical protein
MSIETIARQKSDVRDTNEPIDKVNRGDTHIVEEGDTPIAVIALIGYVKTVGNVEEIRRRSREAAHKIGEAFKDVPQEELDREVEWALREARRQLRAEVEARENAP